MKFAAPKEIENNFLHFSKDLTFSAQDQGISIAGKWKVNIDKREIINYGMNNSSLTKDIVFTIIQLTRNKLAITSKPASGGQIVLHYISSN